MEPSEKKGVALPTRQAGGPGTAGGNNYRRFPHGFPQEAWKTAPTPAERKHAERSMSRKRRMRGFSPAEGTLTFLFPENTRLCRRANACRLVAYRTASGAGDVNCGCTLVLGGAPSAGACSCFLSCVVGSMRRRSPSILPIALLGLHHRPHRLLGQAGLRWHLRLSLSILNGRILLVNPLQSSRSTFSQGSLLSFFAFKEGMLGAPISVLEG